MSKPHEVHWADWKTWRQLLWDKWVKSVGRKKIMMRPLDLYRLFEWFNEACKERNIDPDEVDVASYVTHDLTFGDAKRALDAFVGAPPTTDETESMYEETVHMLQTEVREKYPEAFEELDKRIAELEKETEALPREKRAKEKWKRTAEEIQYKLEETKRKIEAERAALERKVSPVKLRILRDFEVGIMKYKAGQEVETPDIDWALELINKEIAERVPVEAPPVKVVPPAVPPRKWVKVRFLSDEEVNSIWNEFIAYAKLRYPELIPDPAIYKDRFEVSIKDVKDVGEGYGKATRLVEAIVKELKPPPVPTRVEGWKEYPYVPPALEAVELEADFKKFLAEVGITMEEYRRLETVGRITMREEYRRWRGKPY